MENSTNLNSVETDNKLEMLISDLFEIKKDQVDFSARLDSLESRLKNLEYVILFDTIYVIFFFNDEQKLTNNFDNFFHSNECNEYDSNNKNFGFDIISDLECDFSDEKYFVLERNNFTKFDKMIVLNYNTRSFNTHCDFCVGVLNFICNEKFFSKNDFIIFKKQSEKIDIFTELKSDDVKNFCEIIIKINDSDSDRDKRKILHNYFTQINGQN